MRRFGRIDTWVNDAAVGAYGRFEDMPVEALRRLIDVNVFGYIHGTREALARFRAQEAGGVVIQVASVAAARDVGLSRRRATGPVRSQTRS